MLKEGRPESWSPHSTKRPEDLAPEDGSPAKTSEWKESVVSATVGEALRGSPGYTRGTPPTVSIHVQVRCTADESRISPAAEGAAQGSLQNPGAHERRSESWTSSSPCVPPPMQNVEKGLHSG